MTETKTDNLIIGCGRRPKTGAVNLDLMPLPGVDVVFDLNSKEEIPLEANRFNYVEAEDVLEHVDDIVAVMEKIYRVMRTGGKLWIRVPHANYPEQAWRDPTHKRLFVPGSFDNWDPSTRDGKLYGHYFGNAKFTVVEQTEKNKGMEYVLKKI